MEIYEAHKRGRDDRLVALKCAIAGQRMARAARQMQILLRKAGFRPDQARVPRGHSDGGRWTRVGDARGPLPPDEKPRLDLRPPGIGHNHDNTIPLEDPPEVPRERPPTAKLRHAIIRTVARWLLKALFRGALGPVGVVLFALDAAYWTWVFYPWIQAYLQAPKTLAELQHAARAPKQEGYEDHHIVEQTAARNSGFPRSEINAPGNIVRISKLRHWQISAWYRTANKKFGGLTPREYLRDKSWEERERVGLEALREFGALKP